MQILENVWKTVGMHNPNRILEYISETHFGKRLENVQKTLKTLWAFSPGLQKTFSFRFSLAIFVQNPEENV